MEESNKQKQTHFIEQTQKLSKERDDAVKTKNDIKQQCEEKMSKYDEIMAEVNLKSLEQEKQIGKLIYFILHFIRHYFKLFDKLTYII